MEDPGKQFNSFLELISICPGTAEAKAMDKALIDIKERSGGKGHSFGDCGQEKGHARIAAGQFDKQGKTAIWPGPAHFFGH